MQTAQTTVGVEGVQNTSVHGSGAMNQYFPYPNGFNGPSMSEIPSQMDTFMSPSNSSSLTFNTPPVAEMDKVSSVVSMLKGTLERKKINNQTEKEVLEDRNCNGAFPTQEVMVSANFIQGQRNQIHEKPLTFQEISPMQFKDCGVIQMIDASMDLELDDFVNSTNPIQSSRVSQEPSQSESSAAAPVVSSGFDACDGPSNSSQARSVSKSSRKQSRNGSSENGSRAKGITLTYNDIREFRKISTYTNHDCPS